MLTEDNFKTYVGFQECKSSPCMVFLLEYAQPNPDSWVDGIRKMTNDDVLERLTNDEQPGAMSLNITKHVVICDMTFERVLDVANEYLRSFPKTDRREHYAKTRIAFNSRRGAGNQTIDDIVLYKGSNEFDSCLVIAKYGDLYGLVKHPRFSDYGFVLIK